MPILSQKDGKYIGIYADIIQAISKELKIEYDIAPVPRRRLEQLLQTNQFQIGGLLNKNWVQTENFSWTIPLYVLNSVFLTRKDRKFQFNSLEDVKGLHIGCQLGFSYSRNLMEYFSRGEIKRDNAPYLRQNIKRLEFKFIDAVVLSQIEAEYILHTNPKYREIFEIQSMLESSDLIYLMCSKKIHVSIQEMNKIIIKLQKNNTIKNIFKKYGVHI